MTNIEKLYNYIFKRDWLPIFIVFCIYIIFHIPFELLLNNVLVKYAWQYIDPKWYNDLIFALIIFCLVLSFLYQFRKSFPSRNLSFIVISICLLYSYYRFVDRSIWVFTELYYLSWLCYADIIFLLGVSSLILLVGPEKVTWQKNDNTFIEDVPIKNIVGDKLGYNNYAEQIAIKILNSHFDKSFAIGINGKWGLGKSSFIELIKSNIDLKAKVPSGIIEIDFHPWNSNSPQAIIQDFFETVQEAIRPYHSPLARLLISYSKKLVNLNDNTITQTLQTSINALTGFESSNSLFKDINDTLKKVNKKIVIYIDDIDRLDKSEIIEVIRLIRNTANFYQTFFIVAYDRNYVINAIKGFNQTESQWFLEKIFQIEVTLPYFKVQMLRFKLTEILKERIAPEYHETIDNAILGLYNQKPLFLDEWLESMRDVTRLSNSLILNLSNLLGEVDFVDLLRLELLRLKYPSVYQILHSKTSEFLTTKGETKQKIVLRDDPDNKSQKYLKLI